MSGTASYLDYVGDKKFMSDYADYQQRYAENIRESDRAILDLVRPLVGKSDEQLKLIDIGCSTGNLLLHLKHAFPDLALVGGEMPDSILEANRSNSSLAGIEFVYTDLINLELEAAYDIATINAVFYLFDDDQYRQALKNVRRALRPGGTMILFDFFHSFEQDLAILEKSSSHPEGITLHFRPSSQVRQMMSEAGFGDVQFHPFEIPIDLEGDPNSPDLISYTQKREDGQRMLFRGTLFQPWCHCQATAT